jgi:predicted thioesterase
VNINISPGIKHREELLSTEDHSATAFGSGSVYVFATPAMIALMEKTAHNSILNHLPATHTSVGTELSIKHLKASPIGAKIRSDSYLKEVEGNRLLFELHAWDDSGLIGIGTHTRVIVEENSFLRKLK